MNVTTIPSCSNRNLGFIQDFGMNIKIFCVVSWLFLIFFFLPRKRSLKVVMLPDLTKIISFLSGLNLDILMFRGYA